MMALRDAATERCDTLVQQRTLEADDSLARCAAIYRPNASCNSGDALAVLGKGAGSRFTAEQ
jgi:hypothetical protein